MMGKFHIKMGNIYNKLAGVLMDKGEYETALSFYAKTYAIMDATLGIHDDTKEALANVRLAAEKARGAKSSMDILVKVEEEFKKRHPSLNGETDTDSEGGDDKAKDDKKMNGHSDNNKENVGSKKSSSFSKGKDKGKPIVKEEELDII
jgi:hypothetical protein